MELYAFGSVTAGDVDPFSDTDVLAIVETQAEANQCPIHWSIYRRARIRHLFDRGTLFSWHIHLDAVLLWPRDQAGFLATLGRPAPYTGARKEISELLELAQDAIGSLRDGSPSAIFDAGQLYVALRDTAMAAAPSTLGRFDFSRRLPLDWKDPPLPIPGSDYLFYLQCRRTSGRYGVPAPKPPSGWANRAPAIPSWIRTVLEAI